MEGKDLVVTADEELTLRRVDTVAGECVDLDLLHSGNAKSAVHLCENGKTTHHLSPNGTHEASVVSKSSSLKPETTTAASSATSTRNPSPCDRHSRTYRTSFESSRPSRLAERSTARVSVETHAHLEDLPGVLLTAPSQRLPASTSGANIWFRWRTPLFPGAFSSVPCYAMSNCNAPYYASRATPLAFAQFRSLAGPFTSRLSLACCNCGSLLLT